MLYMLGGVMFNVVPTNLHAFERETGGDYAPKDLVGAPRPREFMGEADTLITLAGKIFPRHFGGLGDLAMLQAMARGGQPHMLLRGDGAVLGWHVIEKITDEHDYLDAFGVGRKIEFEIKLAKVPTSPGPGSILSAIISLFG